MLLKVKAATSAVLYWAFRLTVRTRFSLLGDQVFGLFSFSLIPSLSTLLASGHPQLAVPTTCFSPWQNKDERHLAKCRKQREK